MADKRTLGQGNVTLRLTNAEGEDKEFILKPSVHAMRMLSRKYGGLMPLSKRVSDLEFDVVVDVIEAGLQIPPTPKARSELEALVYNTGLSDQTGSLPQLCIRYLTTLIHGGRIPPAEAERDAEGNPPVVAA